MYGTLPSAGVFTFDMIAIDKAGQSALVETFPLDAKPEDTSDPNNGPNGQGCGLGSAVDDVEFDLRFTCNCNATRFEGDNCDVEIPAATGGGDSENVGAVAGGLVAAFIILGVLALVAYKYRVHTINMRAFDFRAEALKMVESGEFDGDTSLVPREIKRSHVTMLSKIGAGAFGEVWKATLDESAVGGVPGKTFLIAGRCLAPRPLHVRLGSTAPAN